MNAHALGKHLSSPSPPDFWNLRSLRNKAILHTPCLCHAKDTYFQRQSFARPGLRLASVAIQPAPAGRLAPPALLARRRVSAPAFRSFEKKLAENRQRRIERDLERLAKATRDEDEDEVDAEDSLLRDISDEPNSEVSTSGAKDEEDSKKGKKRVIYPPAQRKRIRRAWKRLMRWSKGLRKNKTKETALDKAKKVVVFGGGSFGTAIGTILARQKESLKNIELPKNLIATTCHKEAISNAQYAVHAVPLQKSRDFLMSVKGLIGRSLAMICVSKGLELGSGDTLSDIISQVISHRQPVAFLSGPSFALELMEARPTCMVAASKDARLAREMQELFASPYVRINTTSDVIGVELCGALKNVLALAAGIVEGLDLGHNAMAALVTQGCAEITWLSEKLGAKPSTAGGLAGLGDIMLTCYGSLSRNRSVGVKLGQGIDLADIINDSTQVAEGIGTAGVVVDVANHFRVKLPVLTAVAHILDSNLSPGQAVAEIMNLPQINEKE